MMKYLWKTMLFLILCIGVFAVKSDVFADVIKLEYTQDGITRIEGNAGTSYSGQKAEINIYDSGNVNVLSKKVTIEPTGYYYMRTVTELNGYGDYKLVVTEPNGTYQRIFSYIETTDTTRLMGEYSKTDDAMQFRADAFGSSGFYKLFSEPQISGRKLISFDVCMNSTTADTCVRLINGQNISNSYSSRDYLYDAISFKDLGGSPTFGMYCDLECSWSGGVLEQKRYSYEANTWYHIDLCLDMDRRIATIFRDNVYMNEADIPESLNNFYGFCICSSTNKTADVFMVKNFEYIEIPEYADGIDIGNKSLPIYIMQSINTEYKSHALGNIYFDTHSIPINIEFYNKKSTAQNIRIENVVTDCNDDVLWKDEKVKLLMPCALSEAQLNIRLENSQKQYGIFKLRTVITTESDEIIEMSTRFSCANGSTDGFLNTKMGLNTFTGQENDTKFLKEKIALQANGGFGVIRDEILWSKYEQKVGEFKMPANCSRWLDAAMDENIDEFLILGYKSSLYGNEDYPKSDSELEHWADYVYNLVNETKDKTSCYEVWNEWNLTEYNKGASADDYIKLLRVTYDTVKRAAPYAKVYAPALGYSSSATATAFLEDCFANGIYKYCDGISIHPYFTISEPEEGVFMARINEVKNLLSQYDCENLSVVVSEFGWTTDANHLNMYGIGETEQAKYSVRAAALSYNEVDKLIWYINQEKHNKSDEQNHFGIIRPYTGVDIPFEAKPAFLALSNFNSYLAQSTLTEKYTKDDIYDYEFLDCEGNIIHMIWTTETSGKTYSLKTNWDCAKLIDLYGNSDIVYSDDGTFDICLSDDSPVYLKAYNSSDMQLEIKSNGKYSIIGGRSNGEYAALQVFYPGYSKQDFESGNSQALAYQDQCDVKYGQFYFDPIVLNGPYGIYDVSVCDGNTIMSSYILYSENGIGIDVRNENGEKISSLSQANKNIIVDVIANLKKEKALTSEIYIAKYKENKLTDVDVYSISESKNEITVPKEKEDCIKVFAMTKNLVPLAECVRLSE